MGGEKHRARPEGRTPASGGKAAGLGLGSCFFILLVIFIAYSRSFTASFVFDDRLNITDNPYIRITRLEPSQLFRAALQDKFQTRLLSNLSFGLDYYFHGLNPEWMHAENIAIHGLNAIILFFILLSLAPASLPENHSGEEKGETRKWGRVLSALGASLFWALHPAHTQAVTYLVQRQTLLAATGGLLAFLAFIKARNEEKKRTARGWWMAVILGLILAAGSKETGFMAPLILALYELLPGSGKRGKSPGKTLAFIALAGILVLSAGLLVSWQAGILPAYLQSYQKLGYGPGGRLLTECRVIISYLAVLFFPHPALLALDHQVAVSRGLLSPLSTLPALIFILAGLNAAWFFRRRRPWLSFFILGFLLILAPESSLIPVELKYDHRMYMGSLFAVAPAAFWVLNAIKPEKRRLLALLPLSLLAALAWQRNLVWQTPLSVWRDSIKKSPGLARPWSNYCAALAGNRRYEDALPSCERALSLDPDEVMALVNKGVALMGLGRESEAGAAFKKAVEKQPGHALSRYNYGLYLEKTGKWEEALDQYAAALSADPFHRASRYRLALLLMKKKGEWKRAKQELKTLVSFFPSYYPGWLALARAAKKTGESGLAVQALSEALRAGAPLYRVEQFCRELKLPCPASLSP